MKFGRLKFGFWLTFFVFSYSGKLSAVDKDWLAPAGQTGWLPQWFVPFGIPTLNDRVKIANGGVTNSKILVVNSSVDPRGLSLWVGNGYRFVQESGRVNIAENILLQGAFAGITEDLATMTWTYRMDSPEENLSVTSVGSLTEVQRAASFRLDRGLHQHTSTQSETLLRISGREESDSLYLLNGPDAGLIVDRIEVGFNLPWATGTAMFWLKEGLLGVDDIEIAQNGVLRLDTLGIIDGILDVLSPTGRIRIHITDKEVYGVLGADTLNLNGVLEVTVDSDYVPDFTQDFFVVLISNTENVVGDFAGFDNLRHVSATGELYILYPVVTNEYVAVLPIQIGDMDLSGTVDSFDINNFELAIADPNAYFLKTGLDPNLIGDMNGDGVLNSFDIPLFEALLAD